MFNSCARPYFIQCSSDGANAHRQIKNFRGCNGRHKPHTPLHRQYLFYVRLSFFRASFSVPPNYFHDTPINSNKNKIMNVWREREQKGAREKRKPTNMHWLNRLQSIMLNTAQSQPNVKFDLVFARFFFYLFAPRAFDSLSRARIVQI